jgi:hypothetical protein
MKKNIDFNLKHKYNITPLLIACKTIKDIEIWKLILQKEIDFNIKTTNTKNITSPLIEAMIHIGDIEIWKLILEKNINFNTDNKTYYSPLSSLFENVKNKEIIKLILSKTNINLNLPNCYGFTPIHSLCSHIYDDDIWNIILQKEVNFNVKSNYDMYNVDNNSTPLLYLFSINKISFNIWKQILERDLNFYDRNYWSATPLSTSFKNIKNIELLKLIINKVIDNFDKTLINLIKDNNLKQEITDYYNLIYNNLNTTNFLNLDEIYKQFCEYINETNSVNPLFFIEKSTGTHSYFMTENILNLCNDNEKYSWMIQIANNGERNNFRIYNNGYFPVGFYNPYETEISFGLLVDEQYCGKYTILPKKYVSIFNSILPFIPYLEKKGPNANMIMLMLSNDNKKEPNIIYCFLPWNNIDNIFNNLNKIISITTITGKELKFKIFDSINSYKYITSL